MRINVMGEKVSDKVVKMYVNELLKAHPERRISAIDIIVEGDFLKVKCEYEEFDNVA
ncbi:MAG: hypothetical protein IKB73_03665 [Ruminococcus sp.]|nr:hypothetical protein [Ruminococcus sp.]